MTRPRAGSDSSRSSGGQADERRRLSRGVRNRGRVSSSEDVILGSVLESPLGIVGRLLVIVSAEDDVGVGVGPV